MHNNAKRITIISCFYVFMLLCLTFVITLVNPNLDSISIQKAYSQEESTTNSTEQPISNITTLLNSNTTIKNNSEVVNITSIDCNNSQVSNNSETPFNCMTFKFKGSANTLFFQCSLDNAGYRPCITNQNSNLSSFEFDSKDNGSITFLNLNPGIHNFSIYPMDNSDTINELPQK